MLKQGKPKYRKDIARGIENAPQAFIGMLQGKNLVQMSEAERTHRRLGGAA